MTAGLLSAAELAALATSCPAREDFGPESAHPLLAFALEGADARLAGWLRDLPCPVIGIGASAGGLEALLQLLERLPSDAGGAFVILQHLSAGRESVLPAVISVIAIPKTS